VEPLQVNETAGSDFFDRCARFIRKGPKSADNRARLRHQYEAFIDQNRDLFPGARVLDIMSSYGLWSFAALDAGAAHVVGLESSRVAVEAAKAAFADYPVDPGSCRIINSEVAGSLRRLEPQTFNLALCHGYLERADPRFVFHQLARLQIQHVILDTRIVRGKGPIARFSVSTGEVPAGRYQNIVAAPNHDLIAFLCDYFQFQWQLIDWQAMGINDWTSIPDYKNDHRRTYLLKRADGS
jgi:hypothetical protein